MNIKPLLNIEDVPDTKDTKFWNNVDNPEIKGFIMFLIMNTLRAVKINSLTPDESKTMLAKLCAYQELLDGCATLINTQQPQLDL